jgi:hypothetical protein
VLLAKSWLAIWIFIITKRKLSRGCCYIQFDCSSVIHITWSVNIQIRCVIAYAMSVAHFNYQIKSPFTLQGYRVGYRCTIRVSRASILVLNLENLGFPRKDLNFIALLSVWITCDKRVRARFYWTRHESVRSLWFAWNVRRSSNSGITYFVVCLRRWYLVEHLIIGTNIAWVVCET